MASEPAFYKALDEIGMSCVQHAGPNWSAEWRERIRETPRPLPDDRGMMRQFAVAIAYSQGARSSSVRHLIREPVFAEAFIGFDPGRLARRSPEVILRRYWNRLSYIRFKGKVTRIVGCAKVLTRVSQEIGDFGTYLKSFRIPRRLRAPDDIDRYWERFGLLQVDLREREMPFFRSTTSLLQLLLDLDYDSVKPDLIVMRLARRIGIVERELGEKHIRAAARRIQEFAVARAIRAQAVDLQMLAFGGQTGSRQLLKTRFCPASAPCRNELCSVGELGFCSDFEST